MRILVVEDEFNLADVISTRLKKEKYSVDVSLDGEDGLYNALTGIYDLIILDVMLPKVNGFDILKNIKEEGVTSKVIMLTARSMLEDKLNGFSNGADDYVTKPFHIDELVARVNVQLRKQDKQIDMDVIEIFDLKLNTRNLDLECTTSGETINVVGKEFVLLEYFMNNPGQVISKEQIYDKVWGLDNESESNNLEAYLSFIRKKLKIISSSTNIKAVRGLGYKLEGKDGKA